MRENTMLIVLNRQDMHDWGFSQGDLSENPSLQRSLGYANYRETNKTALPLCLSIISVPFWGC